MSVAKAIAAGVVAFTGALVTGLADETLKASELAVAFNAGVVAFVATYYIPNRNT